MNKEEFAKKIGKFVPEEAVEGVTELLFEHPVQLKITRPRKTKLGDYRPLTGGKRHRITINRDLNQYAFLITLIHEIAHMQTWVTHQNKVKPHGEEWKENFKHLLLPFLKSSSFPADIKGALFNYLGKTYAASCSDPFLTKTLLKYNAPGNAVSVLMDLPDNAVFEYGNGRLFRKELKLRKRYKCQELKSGKYYLFNPVTEVKPVEKDAHQGKL